MHDEDLPPELRELSLSLPFCKDDVDALDWLLSPSLTAETFFSVNSYRTWCIEYYTMRERRFEREDAREEAREKRV